jgi:MOSC domain-containing protein YiiM
MVEEFRDLGTVKMVQLQPSGLIIDTPSGYFYDPSRRVEVDHLLITSKGIEATTPAGEHVLDIHHLDHPDKEYDDDDLVCIGFTSHYQAMRTRFGDHMVDGIAGENIIIEYPDEIWLDDLGDQIGIENQETGQLLILDQVQVAAPCEEFSHFAAQSQHEKLPVVELKGILQFLNNGHRGFLLVLRGGQDEGVVRPGDKVFSVQSNKH